MRIARLDRHFPPFQEWKASCSNGLTRKILLISRGVIHLSIVQVVTDGRRIVIDTGRTAVHLKVNNHEKGVIVAFASVAKGSNCFLKQNSEI